MLFVQGQAHRTDFVLAHWPQTAHFLKVEIPMCGISFSPKPVSSVDSLHHKSAYEQSAQALAAVLLGAS